MKRQSSKRQHELIAKYPLLGQIKEMFFFIRPCRIVVQKTGPEAMHMSLSDIPYAGSGYLIDPKKDLRGTLHQELYAAGVYHEKLATLKVPREDPRAEILSKDIFLKTPPEGVSYLIYARVYHWFTPSCEKIATFGEEVSRELVLIVLLKPKGMNFAELVALADRQKKEREDAWQFPPKEQPELLGIHEALRKGYRGHAFLSGGGLRVISFSKGSKEKAYGEHPHIEEALIHADEDYLAGGRPYKEVYGKKYPHYLTGDTVSTSNLDYWIRQSHTFDVWQDGESIVVELKGLTQTKVSKTIEESVLQMEEGEGVLWQDRGYVYFTERSQFPNGKPCVSTRVIKKPRGDKNELRAWMYSITKTGRGSNFHEAAQNAFAAPEVEVPDSL
jgi:hypothetical protein